ncbi:MAG TPA: serine/threonine-protein kinase [Polyangiaceae bacterium]|nr:serine/threonine-protein kinase [Polyangiaceae bacterium]
MKERQTLDEKYVVIRQLGSGPTGGLYEGENLLLGNRVAIKMIDAALARRPGVAERVLRKAREAARLDHPNIASLLDLGEFEGRPYIVTEPLGGHSVQREIDARVRPKVPFACDLILQLSSALDYAHANGVVHGALQPNNLLISYPRPGVPWVKVTDFGLFHALEDVHGDGPNPAPVGGFRAPEYALGGEIDQRADVYSAAALLHALLHGVPPGSEAETSNTVPEELTRVLVEALRQKPRDRIASAQLLANRLAPFAQQLSRPTEVRFSSPPSIRWVNQGPPSSMASAASAADSFALAAAAIRMPLEIERVGPVEIEEVQSPEPPPARDAGVTESLLRNPRFPSDHRNVWLRRNWRALRSSLASHPNIGAAWLFALASVGAGIACALLAAWMQ